jgi:hypothetical protein
MKTLQAKPGTVEQLETPSAAADKMHPVVNTFQRTMYDGIKRKSTAPFYALFAPDVMFVFDEDAYPLHDWMEKEVFNGRWSGLMIGNITDGGLSIHIDFIAPYEHANSFWKFQIAGDKIKRLDAGNL